MKCKQCNNELHPQYETITCMSCEDKLHDAKGDAAIERAVRDEYGD